MLPKVASPGALLFLHGRMRIAGALLLRSLSTATSAPPEAHLMVDYLISSCGFSSTAAVKASKSISHLKSTRKPESFLEFMRSHGFNSSQIKKIISCNPKILCADVDKTLKPKFQSFQDWGFSDSDLTLLLVSNPNLLHSSFDKILPRFKFWESFLGSKEHLKKLSCKSNHCWFLSRDIEKWVMPNISLLNEFGISNQKIAVILQHNPGFIIQSPEKFRSEVERVQRLGVPRSSGMFLWALWVLNQVSNNRFDGTKQLLMRSFGWSEEEFVAVFRRAPALFMVSQETLSKKMDFLIKEVGCKPSELSHYPNLLSLSLERRLVPRHHVLQHLRSRGLLCREPKPCTYMTYTDQNFMKRLVTPYKEKVPELQEIYSCSIGNAV